jgi:hypothetical protein
MRAGRFLSWAAVIASLLALTSGACGQMSDSASPADGGDVPYALVRDSGVHYRESGAVTQEDARHSWNRMSGHQKRVLSAMRLQAVYIGFEGDDGAPDFDDFHTWLLSSSYWSILAQYGVGAGTSAASVRLSTKAALPASLVKNGLISAEDFDARVLDILHGSRATRDGGADPDAAADAAMDPEAGTSGGGHDAGLPLIPAADAYIFFLPNGVNVSLGERGGHVFRTCVDAGGYHSYDGSEPYAVIPPCSLGRSPFAISHELTEMATDPFPGGGWYSDADVDNAGGEIGDLCNQQVPHGVEGWSVTQLWSNADGTCQPD